MISSPSKTALLLSLSLLASSVTGAALSIPSNYTFSPFSENAIPSSSAPISLDLPASRTQETHTSSTLPVNTATYYGNSTLVQTATSELDYGSPTTHGIVTSTIISVLTNYVTVWCDVEESSTTWASASLSPLYETISKTITVTNTASTGNPEFSTISSPNPTSVLTTPSTPTKDSHTTTITQETSVKVPSSIYPVITFSPSTIIYSTVLTTVVYFTKTIVIYDTVAQQTSTRTMPTSSVRKYTSVVTTTSVMINTVYTATNAAQDDTTTRILTETVTPGITKTEILSTLPYYGNYSVVSLASYDNATRSLTKSEHSSSLSLLQSTSTTELGVAIPDSIHQGSQVTDVPSTLAFLSASPKTVSVNSVPEATSEAEHGSIRTADGASISRQPSSSSIPGEDSADIQIASSTAGLASLSIFPNGKENTRSILEISGESNPSATSESAVVLGPASTSQTIAKVIGTSSYTPLNHLVTSAQNSFATPTSVMQTLNPSPGTATTGFSTLDPASPTPGSSLTIWTSTASSSDESTTTILSTITRTTTLSYTLETSTFTPTKSSVCVVEYDDSTVSDNTTTIWTSTSTTTTNVYVTLSI